MRPALVVNRTLDRAVEAYRLSGQRPEDVVRSDDPGVLAQAIADRRPAVSPTADVIPALGQLDVVCEVTGAMDHGARVILAAMAAGAHVVSMNAEVDATLGWLLHDAARRHGVVYTVSDGDQPGVLLRHLEFVSGMGFRIIAAVNCKRNLDVHQDRAQSAAYARRDSTSLFMTTAMGDGTKMQVENAVVANCTGLVPDVRGMHGVRTTLEHAARDIPAVLSRFGVVEYTLGGDFAAGVTVIGTSDEPEMTAPYMRYFKMGDGPHYSFFRPYHLVHLELPVTVAQVMLDRMALGEVTRPVAEVVAVAKRDLRPGEPLDGIGGDCVYGHVDTVERAAGVLPVGLTDHARVTRHVARDQPVPLDAVELDEDAEIVRLRRAQDAAVSALV